MLVIELSWTAKKGLMITVWWSKNPKKKIQKLAELKQIYGASLLSFFLTFVLLLVLGVFGWAVDAPLRQQAWGPNIV